MSYALEDGTLMNRTAMTLCLAGVSALAGCGTVLDMSPVGHGEWGPPHVYGGLRVHYHYPDSHELWVLDLPFCFLGDTVLLPISIPAELLGLCSHPPGDSAHDWRPPPAPGDEPR